MTIQEWEERKIIQRRQKERVERSEVSVIRERVGEGIGMVTKI